VFTARAKSPALDAAARCRQTPGATGELPLIILREPLRTKDLGYNNTDKLGYTIIS
jgi:hypothetical protein